MAGFESPNYTQTPNEFFDIYLAIMGEAEIKVVAHAIRQTLGWKRETDEISISQFQKATGLSRQGVIDGIDSAIKRGLMREAGIGKRGVKRYGLVILVDQSTQQTSQDSRPDVERGLVNVVDTQKKEKKKDSPPAGETSRNDWYDAILDIWKYTGKMNGAMQKMLQGTATAKGWKEYNLEQPLASSAELRAWAAWYRATQLNGNARLNMLERRDSIQSSIGYWQSTNRPDAPAAVSDDDLPINNFDKMLEHLGL